MKLAGNHSSPNCVPGVVRFVSFVVLVSLVARVLSLCRSLFVGIDESALSLERAPREPQCNRQLFSTKTATECERRSGINPINCARSARTRNTHTLCKLLHGSMMSSWNLRAFAMKTFGNESALRSMCQLPSVLLAKFAGALEWPL